MPADLVMVLRVLLALALGAVIGYERERRGKGAGLRTHMLITLGAALFTVVSIYAFGRDYARLAAGIVTGIGFLGAGTIIKNEQGGVSGLTTAASIWVAAAVGVACGTGLYIVATVTTLLTLVILLLRDSMVNRIVKKDENEPR